MRASVDSYAYVLIRLARLRKIRLNLKTIQKFDEISTIEEFRAHVIHYYPDVQLPEGEFSVLDFEREMWGAFFRIITRILNASPEKWQLAITGYLLKYQIKNVKTIILGKIAGLDEHLIRANINWDVEELFQSNKITEMLLAQKTIREIQYSLRDSRYSTVLREGLSHYYNDEDTFYFQVFLDRYYYQNLLTIDNNLPDDEAVMMHRLSAIDVESYNVRTIYRALNHSFEPRMISEMLVFSDFYLHKDQLTKLIEMKDPAKMGEKYLEFYAKGKIFKYLQENPVLKNFTFYVYEFYNLLSLQSPPAEDELEVKTLHEILQIIKLQEYSIYRLTRTLTRIVHKLENNTENFNE